MRSLVTAWLLGVAACLVPPGSVQPAWAAIDSADATSDFQAEPASLDTTQPVRTGKVWGTDPETGLLVHIRSNILLPRSYGVFLFEDAEVFQADGSDVGIQYGTDGARLTIYISEFPFSERQHFNSTVQDIANHGGPMELVESGEFQADAAGGTVTGPYALFRSSANVAALTDASTSAYRTGVIVKQIGPRHIKMRFTYLESQASAVEPMIQNVFDSFDWPAE